VTGGGEATAQSARADGEAGARRVASPTTRAPLQVDPQDVARGRRAHVVEVRVLPRVHGAERHDRVVGVGERQSKGAEAAAAAIEIGAICASPAGGSI